MKPTKTKRIGSEASRAGQLDALADALDVAIPAHPDARVTLAAIYLLHAVAVLTVAPADPGDREAVLAAVRRLAASSRFAVLGG